MKTSNSSKFKTLLLVGPKPPPIGGSPLTVQAIIDELASYSDVKLSILNTSPTGDVRKKMTGLNFEKIWRTISMFSKYIGLLKSSDTVLVFANNLFALTIAPAFLLLAHLFHKPFYLKPVGGDLDLYIKSLWAPVNKWFLGTLRAADGVLVQTRLLQEALNGMGCPNAIYLPGFRTKPSIIKHDYGDNEILQLIFLAHIMRPKGPLVLLEALQLVSKTCSLPISCDFYGPIHNEIRSEFTKELEKTPSAKYCGVAEPGSGSSLIAMYDVLVLPTYFICEGHTGVLIEAMHAGVPVISTYHRSVPELVADGENGILVPPRDSQALAEAIKQFALDRSLRERMGYANLRRGEEFRTDKVVAQLVSIVFQPRN